MEMIIKNKNVARRNLFAVAIFLSASTLNCTADGIELRSVHAENIFGTGNVFTQRTSIFFTGNAAVGIHVGGVENYLRIPVDTTIKTDGSGSKGVLVSYGRNNRIHVGGKIFSAGNGVEFNFTDTNDEYRGSYLRYVDEVNEFGQIAGVKNLPLLMKKSEFIYTADELNGALVNSFDITGTISGNNRAIYISPKSFVRNINVYEDAEIFGDIVSDWKHLNATNTNFGEKVSVQYQGRIFDTTQYIPDLVTNLNFRGDINYGGNIVGADNIKIHVREGTLNFSGAANVVSVNVHSGAKLFGGTFRLNDMTSKIAADFSDSTTGTFINHGTIGAGSPNTNLIIDGNLRSDGFLQKVSGGKEGSIIVHGSANVEGSTVTTDSLLPNETATVLVADSITGNIKNPKGKPVPISAMLSATGEVVGNKITVTTHAADNFNYLNSREADTFDAMQNMFGTLDKTNQNQMRDLYNLELYAAKETLTQIGSNDAAQVMSVAQQSTAVDKMIAERITTIFAPDYVDLNVSPLNFADDDNSAVKVSVKVPTRQENNFWLNYSKNWGTLRSGTDYHGSVIVGGYDRAFGSKWRGGIFATYGTIGYGADSSRATVYDTRLGLYSGYHNRASDVYFYVNGGQLRNSLHRGISSLGLSTNANYDSRIIEFGGEYKYDLQPRRIWHVNPFVNFQISHLRQSSYDESGAGIYNQHVDATGNTYFAAQTGLDLKRYYRRGMFGLRFGIKHGFTGVDPDLQISYEGDTAHSYRLRQQRDKTHFTFGVRGENEISYGWFVGGEAELQLGEHDRDLTASLMLRHIW